MNPATPFEIIPPCAEETPFSPRMAADELGVRIAAPDRVVFDDHSATPFDGTFAYVPISVTYWLPLRDCIELAASEESIILVAQDLATGRVLCGDCVGEEGEYDRPEPTTLAELSAEECAELAAACSGGWSTVNLARQVALPAAAATYLVHAALGSHLSNVLEIRVIHRRDDDAAQIP